MNPSTIYNREIENYLANAEEVVDQNGKFKFYCKGAKLQCKAGRIEDAKKTYALAMGICEKGTINDSQSTLDPNIVLLNGHTYFERLLKLAKISAIINPCVIPKEFEDAKNALYDVCSKMDAEDGERAFEYVKQGYCREKEIEVFHRVTSNALLANAYKKANCPNRCIDEVNRAFVEAKLLSKPTVIANIFLQLAETALGIDDGVVAVLLSRTAKITIKLKDDKMDAKLFRLFQYAQLIKNTEK